MMKTILSLLSVRPDLLLLLLIAMSGFLVPFAHATTVIEPTFDELVQEADLIVDGKVDAMKSQWVGDGENRRIETEVSVQVLDLLKGNAPKLYVLHVLGGTVGNQTLAISDAPKFAVGDHVLLFVEKNGTQFIPLVGIMHGHYRIQKNDLSGEEAVIRHDGKALQEAQEIGRPATLEKKSPLRNGTPLAPEAFRQQIRQKVQQQKK